MAAGEDDEEGNGRARRIPVTAPCRWPDGPRCAAGRLLPLWMTSAAGPVAGGVPGVLVRIGPGWRGLAFEAWRDTGGAGL